MRHFYRSRLAPADVIAAADEFFTSLGLTHAGSPPRTRSRLYEGIVGTPEVRSRLRLEARPEGGHYTFVEAATDQIGESRLDRNVKRFFVQLHRLEEPRHALAAAY
ncbi:MAG: hypothetical protein ACT4R6_02275 [Gemmatimonadaceae bacterium]